MSSKLKNKKNTHLVLNSSTPSADETGNIHTSHLRVAVIKRTHARIIIAIASGDKGVSDPETQEGKTLLRSYKKIPKRDL